MTILDKAFPLSISQGSDGGPLFDTTIKQTRAGYERRNKNWSQYRYQANVYQAVQSFADYNTLFSFFLEMGGQAYGFLFTNPGDYKSCLPNEAPAFDDLNLGTGDGTTTAFQLQKTYGTVRTETKTITRPKSGTVLVGVGGTAYTGGWFVDTTTGIVTFDDITKTITDAIDLGGGITRLSALSHGLTVGDSVYLTTFTGDWSALNGTRFAVTGVPNASQFEISYNSSAFAVYSSNGGQLDTIPQTGEALTVGFEYYLPCRFNTDFMRSTYEQFISFDTNLGVVEDRE